VVSWRGRSRCGGARRGGGDAAGVIAGAVEKMDPTSGVQVSAVEREKTLRTEGVKSRRKRIFANMPMTRVGRAEVADSLGVRIREGKSVF
jgi:hypothetical protein